MAKGADGLYPVSVCMLMFVLPVISILQEVVGARQVLDLWNLVGEWFVFWAVGIRLVTAAVMQVANPSFTAEGILGVHGRDSHIIVRELGFANFCMGLIGILSLFVPEWRTAAALGGGLFLGCAGLQHLLKKPSSQNEIVAMLSDIFVFLILAAYLFEVL